MNKVSPKISLKKQLYIIIFHENTKKGKIFDLILLWAIVFSVLTVVVESIPSLRNKYADIFNSIEWFFTILFTLEYFIRVSISPKPFRYIFSFWGLIDFLSSAPTYLTYFFSGAQMLIVVRLIRLLRVFRILKMVRFTREAQILSDAIKSSLHKITIFLCAVLILVLILGTLMYVVEGHQEGFDSIPGSMYWAIVTITTVGYGDLVPQTILGKFVSAVIMIVSYAIIAVPTGIVTAEMSKKQKHRDCPKCETNNPANANFCNECGNDIKPK